MAIPGTPNNFYVQQGNNQVYLAWDISAGATSYSVQRSTDGVTFSALSTPVTNYYLDTSVTPNTQYFYQVASVNSDGTSPYTGAQAITPTGDGVMCLGQLRLEAQQRADRVNSDFVTVPEWNSYINQAAFELYDLLTTVYEDYYVNSCYFTTDGVTSQYTLPNGTNTFQDQDGNTITPSPFYKLLGVDLGITSSTNAWVTVKKFDFISRNRYVYPQLTSTYLGVFNLRYRVVGNTLMFIPTPSAGQKIRLWYQPRLTQLLQDTDTLDGVSGWTEYVIVRAAYLALAKEESDTTQMLLQLNALKQRIEDSAMNRDIGQPSTISDTRSRAEQWGAYGPAGGDGSYGGY